MASISTSADGRKSIQFVAADKKRRTIRLGIIDHDEAILIKRRVAALNVAQRKGLTWDDRLARWVADTSDELAQKLAAVGLIPPRTPLRGNIAPRLNEFLASYIAGRADHAENTRKTIDQARRLLVEYFGADKPIDKITAADALSWRNSLRTRFKPATIATHVKKAKQMFQHAADGEVVEKNPFAKLRAGKQVDSTRQVDVTREITQAILEAAPDAEWRLIIALARYGGLRCPSEHLALTWPDVDWERDRFRVDSPKTGVRWVPIFPELRPHLEEAFELAPEGSIYVITRYRKRNSNLRTRFTRIIRRAGLEPWERLFHNLRSTRQTELTNSFPAHVASKWLGNSVKVATDHYLQVTEEHFRRAAGAVQKAVQYGSESHRRESHGAPNDPGNAVLCHGAGTCGEQNYPRQESNL